MDTHKYSVYRICYTLLEELGIHSYICCHRNLSYEVLWCC